MPPRQWVGTVHDRVGLISNKGEGVEGFGFIVIATSAFSSLHLEGDQ